MNDFDKLADMMIEPSADSGSEDKVRQPAPRAGADDRGGDEALPGAHVATDGDNEEDDTILDDAGASAAPSEEDEDDDTNDEDTQQADDDPLSNLFDEDGQDDADHERDVDGEEDGFDASKLGDDAMLSVTVDGEEVAVSLGDLKRRYAGEGAIERRLQVATEARNKALEDYNKSTELVKGIMERLGQNLFRRTIPAPDESLRRTNPTKYLLDKEQYDAETAALTQHHTGLYNLMQELDGNIEAMKQQRRKEAAQELRRVMPVLADPNRGPKVKDALLQAARDIGYTDAQIAACDDPLMFKTVALAARELRRMKGLKVEKAKETARTIKSKGTQNRSPATVAKRQEKQALERARKTGKLEDLEAAMLVPAPAKRRRR